MGLLDAAAPLVLARGAGLTGCGALEGWAGDACICYGGGAMPSMVPFVLSDQMGWGVSSELALSTR